MATETEIAWAAGLFEGEGCIGWSVPPGKARSLPAPRLVVCSTDRDVLESLQRVLECGAIGGKYKRGPRRKESWSWACTNWADITRVLGLMIPWLHERRALRAMEILETGHLARERECLKCGSLFVARMEKALYCSRPCAWHATRIPKVVV